MAKKIKQTAKSRDLQKSWEKICKEWGVVPGKKLTTRSTRKPLSYSPSATLILNADRLASRHKEIPM